ncbi:MAG TPA: ATP-binding protein [Pseudonocardiaceae bacterium]|nr:ATP-binding protein [Pseudonocardiaceae bacterium]
MQLIEDAELVVSELVTNAVKATGVMDDEPRWTQVHHLALVRVRLVGTWTSVFIEVWDSDETLPTVRQATHDRGGGGDPFILVATCARWNTFRTRGGGKVVWGELSIPPETLTPAELPKRRPTPWPRRQPEATQDPGLLHRVRRGLDEL